MRTPRLPRRHFDGTAPLRRRALSLGVALSTLLGACAHPGVGTTGPAAEARAGELHLSGHSPTAVLRGAADARLRIVVWHPATPSAVERTLPIGSGHDAVFVAGRAAPGAPWAPGAARPLVMLSHGFGGSARQLTWLGTALARHGYIAAAVDHPGTNGLAPMTPEGVYTPWERAQDIRRAIDRLLEDPVVGPRVDRHRIGVAGFSLGGWTALLLAGARPDFDRFRAFCAGPQRDSICDPQREYPLDFNLQPGWLAKDHLRPLAAGAEALQRDPRVRAALLLAPALGQALAADGGAHVRIPVLVVAGDRDTVTPTPTNGRAIADQFASARFESMPGVGHYDFLSLCTEHGQRVAAVYCTDAPGHPRAQTHRRAVELARDFFDRALRQR